MLVKRVTQILMISVVTLWSIHGLAKSLSQDMREIMLNTRYALRTDDKNVFIQAIEGVIQAAKDAQQQTPRRLADVSPESEEMQSYHAAMQVFIDTASKAKQLAEQNDLAQAREQVHKLYDLRNTYHPQYK